MRGFLFALILALASGFGPKGAMAQSMIRDAEIEAGLRNLLAPYWKAAGLGQTLRVILLNDPQMNAFVRDARTIFITSGLMMALDEPAELQAVLAEAAHSPMAIWPEGPKCRSHERGITAGFGGGAFGCGGFGPCQCGCGRGPGTASSAQRIFFSHTRAEEASADAAALQYLERAGIDPAAMGRVLDRFVGQELPRQTAKTPMCAPTPDPRPLAPCGQSCGPQHARSRPRGAILV